MGAWALSFLYRLALRLIDIARMRRTSDVEKDIEIIALRRRRESPQRALLTNVRSFGDIRGSSAGRK